MVGAAGSGARWTAKATRRKPALRKADSEDDRGFDLLFIEGTVGMIGAGIFDVGDNLAALAYFSENGMVAIEPRRSGGGDEKLATVGIGAGIGHGEQAGPVEL